jgi:alanine racemase
MPLTRPRLTVRLDAVADNYRHVLATTGGVPAGAAVKGDAYGLGLAPVTRRLWDEGCREFFVANVDEGIALRAVLPDATINVFNGAMAGTEDELVAHGLVPIVITAGQLEAWRATARRHETVLPVGVHVDTGMHRTGMPPAEVDAVVADPEAFAGLALRHVMSHLASSDEPDSTQPEAQLERFLDTRRRLPGGVASLANSGGVFRDPAFHLDLVRPGIALYGGSPVAGEASPMRQTVVIDAPVIQVREVGPGDRVGYGATYEVVRDETHAVVPVGYADGFHRAASNRGRAAVGGLLVPIVGRVSMDLIVLDVTGVAVTVGDTVELLGDACPVDAVAAAAGTISYEILTALGPRYERVYSG